MSEILEEIAQKSKEYRDGLTPEKRFIHDLMGFGGRYLMLFDREPTLDEFGEWFDGWISMNEVDFRKIFVVREEQRE